MNMTNENTSPQAVDFKILLFRTAFCMLACDGSIHEDEIDEIRSMMKSTNYFRDTDLTEEFESLRISVEKHGKSILPEYLLSLSTAQLNPAQELLVLEVALRLMNADKRVDDNEVYLLRLIRSKLSIHDEELKYRFGSIPQLSIDMNTSYAEPAASKLQIERLSIHMNEIDMTSLGTALRK